jgi:glycerophosphoryl diester phosphodiesterase
VWTVDDEARILALSDMGVDAIITNDPKAARLTLGSASG